MPPSVGKLQFWQDFPLLFLSWLVPTAILIAFAGQHHWSSAALNSADLVQITNISEWFAWHSEARALMITAWPLALLFTLVVGIACCACQVLGKQGMLVALTFCAMSWVVVPHFAPGSMSQDAVLLVLLTSMLAFCLGSNDMPELAVGTGFCASAMIGFGPEALSFIIAIAVWQGFDWASSTREESIQSNQKSYLFGWSFTTGTILTYLVSAYTGPGIFSLTALVPAVLAGAGLAHLAFCSSELHHPRQKFWCLGLLALIVACGTLAVVSAEFDLVATGSTLITDTLKVIQGQQANGLVALWAQNPGTAYGLAATPLVGLAASIYAIAQAKAARAEWALIASCLLICVALMVIDTGFSLFANALATLPCAWLTLAVGWKCQNRRPAALCTAVFIGTWLAGMNFTHSLIGSQLLSPDTTSPLLG